MALGQGDNDPTNSPGGGAGPTWDPTDPLHRTRYFTGPQGGPGPGGWSSWDPGQNDPGFISSVLHPMGGTGGIDPGMFDKFNLNFDPYTSWLQKQGAIPTDPISNTINGSPSTFLGGNYIDPNHVGPISTNGTLDPSQGINNLISANRGTNVGVLDILPGLKGGAGGPALPPGNTYYGGTPGGLQDELNRQDIRGNTIGDAWQNNYGNPNQSQMGLYGRMYSGTGAGYADAGGANGANQSLDRMQQLAYGNAGYGAGRAQMGQSDMYGGMALGAYGQQQQTAAVQGQLNALTGRTVQDLFGQGGQYNGAAQQSGAAALGAQQGMQAYGALGGGYGSSQMGTSQGLLGGAARDYTNQQGSRGQSEQALGRLQNFYQQGPGPSAAQAQLQQSSEANMANALSLARSGRGAGDNAAAMRQAQFQNAATQQQTGQQMAQLRAQESATWRGQQLGAMGQEQSALGNLRSQDLSAMGQNLGSAAQFGGLGYQGIGLGAQQANTLGSQNLTAQGQNLGAMSSLYGLGLQGMGQQQSGLSSARGQDLTAYGANLGAQQGMAGLGYQGYGLGLNASTTAGSQDLSAMANNNQTGLGYAQLGQGYQQTGLQNQLGYANLANQQYTNADQLRAQMQGQQLASDTTRYGVDRGIGIDQQKLNQQQDAANWAKYSSLIAGAVGLLSDVRAKTDIAPVDDGPTLGEHLTNGANAFRGIPSEPKKKKGLLGQVFGKKDPVPSLQEAMQASAPSPSWEQGISPFAAQAMPAPPGVDPRLNQQTVPIDFTQLPGSDERGKEAIHRIGQLAGGSYVSSPREAKKDIRPVDMSGAPPEYANAWGGVSMQDAMRPPTQPASFSMSSPPIVPGRGVDLRPAQGYSYRYKDPNGPGAAPGTHIGPMAQDLEKTSAGKSVVKTGPDGMKRIDTARLSLVNTAALSEQQRRMDRLEQMSRPQIPMSALDAAYEREQADVGSRFGGRR